MVKVDDVVKRETQYIAVVVLILSALLEAIYLFIGLWNYTVLLGNILGGLTGILNFFLMCIGLQSALNKDVKSAKTTAQFSQTYRNIMIIAVLAIAYFVPIFDIIPTVIALIFSTFGVYGKFFTMNKNKNSNNVISSSDVNNSTSSEVSDAEVEK